MNNKNIDINVGEGFIVKGVIWEPENIKGLIVICHGMAEHIHRYSHFSTFLASHGYVVVGYDQRGHGQTARSVDNIGYMSDVNNINILISDLTKIIEFAKDEYPQIPIFLLGHSMGSFISLNYIQNYGKEIDGVILSGSTMNKGVALNFGIILSNIIMKNKGRTYKSKLIHNIVMKPYNNKFKPNRTTADWLSRDQMVADKYVNDDYCGGIFSVSYYYDLFRNFKSINRRLSFIPGELPIYLLSGACDPVSNFSKNIKKLYTRLKNNKVKDLELKIYPEGRHEMLNEINKEEVYNNLLIWLDNHL